jgi:hypothetical protein
MNRARAIFLLGLLAAAGLWLCCTCAVNPNVSFLAPGPGSWIVYPTPPSVPMLDRMPMTAVFRRVFVLPRSPGSATVSWRCFKQGQLILNGQKAATTHPAHWKSTARLEAAAFLHPGTNEMEARVTCDSGLPALSLELETEGFALKSDEAWQCSLEGAVWQPAWPASRPVEPAPGNGIYGAEEIGGALRECWPLLFLFAIVAALAAAANGWRGRLLSGRGQAAGAVLLTVAWALLLLHNFPLLPAMIGFDAPAHLACMEFIQDHAALPSASQGSEFFQAPLYYVLGAGVLGLFHLRALQPEAGQVLGQLNLLLGITELVLILAGLRLLFPGRRRLQLAGLLLAAFLPARVYSFHYPTNEILGAVMTTAALCLCLKMLRRENPGLGWYAGLGMALGAALLSKASAVIALGAVMLALAAKAWCERQCLTAFLRRAGLCLGLCLLMGGWHYWNLWRQFGSPFAGDCDPAVGAAWWQLPGYRTPDYYLSFGQSLARPFFSGFRSFWDGLLDVVGRWPDGGREHPLWPAALELQPDGRRLRPGSGSIGFGVDRAMARSERRAAPAATGLVAFGRHAAAVWFGDLLGDFETGLLFAIQSHVRAAGHTSLLRLGRAGAGFLGGPMPAGAAVPSCLAGRLAADCLCLILDSARHGPNPPCGRRRTL